MENVIYSELIRRGFSVDVGVVDVWGVRDGKRVIVHHEIDFVVETGTEKVYVQSAFSVSDPDYRAREKFPLQHTDDSFRKLIVVNGAAERWTDGDGVCYIGVLSLLGGAEL